MRTVFFILGITALFPPGTAEAQRLVLDGRAHASIVVPDRATTTERFAAGELQAYLSRAWHLAQEGTAARDANRLRQAIELAESACQFVLDQQDKDPHYAAMPGKLTGYVQTWKRQLAQIERRDP